MNELDHNPSINGDTYVKRIKQQQALERSLKLERQRAIRRKKQQKRKRRKIMIATIAAAGIVAVTGLAVASQKKYTRQESDIVNATGDVMKAFDKQNSDGLEVLDDYINARETAQEELEILNLKAQYEVKDVVEDFQKSVSKIAKKVGNNLLESDGVKKNTDPSTWKSSEAEYYYDFVNISNQYGEEFIKKLTEYIISFENASKIWNESLTEDERSSIIIVSCYDKLKKEIERIGGDVNQLDSLVRNSVNRTVYEEYLQDKDATIGKIEASSNQTMNKLSRLVLEAQLGRSLESVTPNIDDYNEYTSSDMENLIYLDEDIYMAASRGGR